MEAFADITDLQEYTGVYPESETQQQTFLNAASEIIVSYLGYDPHAQIKKDYFDGPNDYVLFLNSKPLNKILKLVINDNEVPTADLIQGRSSVILKDRKFPRGNKNIYMEYETGFEVLPDIFKITCLRIAAILQTEAGDNIGITSKSFGDSGSRTFYNFTNFNKYLMALSEYKIF